MSKKRSRSSFVRIARRLGFLNKKSIKVAEDALDEAHDSGDIEFQPEAEILVRAGCLSEDQADICSQVQVQESPSDALQEKVKILNKVTDKLNEATKTTLHVASMPHASRK